MSTASAAKSFVDIRFRAIVLPLVIERFFHPRLVQIRRNRTPLSGIMILALIAEFVLYPSRSITVASEYDD
jgi:hypothetical protein